MRKNTLVFLVLALFMIVPPALAQNSGDGDLQTRMDLARQMHEVKPMNVEIERAIRNLSKRYPEDRQELFVKKMLETFDQKTLTDISIKAMAETFTADELRKMIDYYGSPEGKSIEQKMPVYQAIVEPEIVKKIDEALMEIRTGKVADDK